MVPPHHAPPRSRCRILRLDHIQRSRRDRAIYRSRLYARDKSRLIDNVAGQPSSLHSLAYKSEQFRRQCQPELFALSRHYERYDRVEPQLLISPYLITHHVPHRVTLLSGGTVNSVLTISTTGTTLQGVYTIVVLGVSGTLANSVSITLTV